MALTPVRGAQPPHLFPSASPTPLTPTPPIKVDVLLDSAASGWNTVEREGISISHPARFILVGSGEPPDSPPGARQKHDRDVTGGVSLVLWAAEHAVPGSAWRRAVGGHASWPRPGRAVGQRRCEARRGSLLADPASDDITPPPAQLRYTHTHAHTHAQTPQNPTCVPFLAPPSRPRIRNPAPAGTLPPSGNPEEGELRPQLLDRFGMHAQVGAFTLRDWG
jgi:hypothetical protein